MCKKIITKNKKMSSSNRVYRNFPGINQFRHMDLNAPGWQEISEYIFETQNNMNTEDFRDWISGGNTNFTPRHDNRGFELTQIGWFKYPTSRQQLQNYLRYFQQTQNRRNSNWARNQGFPNSNNNYNAGMARISSFLEKPNNNSRIKWDKKFVKNMPTNEAGSLNNFKDGNKVIQFKAGNINKYMSQYTFIEMAKMSPNIAYNKPQTQILFKNPFTRANVKRGEIKFMVLKDAATKIQSVVRGKKARNVVQTAARRKLLANAAAKRK